MTVKVGLRPEKDGWLAYFFEQRLTVRINEIGAKILDCFLNNEEDVEEIAKKLSAEYNISVEKAETDIRMFLADIYKRLTTANVNEAEQEFLDRPLGVEIEITTACNLRCKHCFQGEYPERYMPFAKFKEIVDILVSNQVYEVNLVGGEFFKHPDVLKMLVYLDENGMAVTIVTNAVAIDDKTIECFKKMKNPTTSSKKSSLGCRARGPLCGRGSSTVPRKLILRAPRGVSVTSCPSVLMLGIPYREQTLTQ